MWGRHPVRAIGGSRRPARDWPRCRSRRARKGEVVSFRVTRRVDTWRRVPSPARGRRIRRRAVGRNAPPHRRREGAHETR